MLFSYGKYVLKNINKKNPKLKRRLRYSFLPTQKNFLER